MTPARDFDEAWQRVVQDLTRRKLTLDERDAYRAAFYAGAARLLELSHQLPPNQLLMEIEAYVTATRSRRDARPLHGAFSSAWADFTVNLPLVSVREAKLYRDAFFSGAWYLNQLLRRGCELSELVAELRAFRPSVGQETASLEL